MQELRESNRLDRSKERSHRRRKRQDDDFPDKNDGLTQSHGYSERHPYVSDANNLGSGRKSSAKYSKDLYHPDPAELSPGSSEASRNQSHVRSYNKRPDSASENLRRSRQSQSSQLSDSSHTLREHYYVNDVNRYEPEEYDEDYGQFDENFPNPEEGFTSSSKEISDTHPHSHSRQPMRDRSYRPSNNHARSVESVSDYNGPSITDGALPQALGGSEPGFWNPELSPAEIHPSVVTAQSEPSSGLRKFIASFRRLKKGKNGRLRHAVSESNAVESQAECSARVIMLDGEELSFAVDRLDTGHTLLTRVCQTADIVETDYFGLTYVSNRLRTWFWLDPEKKIGKQLRNGEQWLFSFQVKFYPPEPTLLQEDITRYQLTLQVRQDIYTGKLPCSWVTQALLGSFMVQAELGDYDEREHGNSIEYLKEFEFIPSPTPQLLQKISELHKTHVGMKPNQADVKYLETAKRLELYGIDLHPVRDSEDVEIYLGVGFHGIVIYRDRLRIGRFAWPKVLRISYKKNNFFLKIRPDNAEPVETIIGFRLLNHHLANRLWKAAVEHHAFFRLKEARSPLGSTARLGSNFNYTGHTFFQYRTMNINRPHPHFDRSLTKRRTASMPMGLNKTPSIHTLNRAHPRDMTVGRTQETDTTARRDGSLPLARQVTSTGQVYSATPSSSQLGLQQRNLRRTGSSRSQRDNYSIDSQSHDYVNQQNGASIASGDQGSYVSGSVLSESTVRQSGSGKRRAQTSNRRPNSPLYTNVRRHVSPDYRPSSDLNSQTVIGRQISERASTSRKPPGGVPVLGGVMLNETAARHTGGVRSQKSKDTERQYDEDHEDFEPPLEYDDDITDAAGHMQTVAHGDRASDLRYPDRLPPSGSTHHKGNLRKPQPSAYASRKEVNNEELML